MDGVLLAGRAFHSFDIFVRVRLWVVTHGTLVLMGMEECVVNCQILALLGGTLSVGIFADSLYRPSSRHFLSDLRRQAFV